MKLVKITNYKTLYNRISTAYIPTQNVKYIEVVNNTLYIWFERQKQETRQSPYYSENQPVLSHNVDYVQYEFNSRNEALMVAESFNDMPVSETLRVERQQRMDMPSPCDLALEELK